MTTERFMRRYVASILSGGTPEMFRSLTQECDALFVDEMEDLNEKSSTLEALDRAVRWLVGEQRSVVMALGAARTEHQERLEHLIRSYPRGAVVRMSTPTVRQKVDALRKLIRVRRARVSQRVVNEVARRARTIPEARCAVERTILLQCLT